MIRSNFVNIHRVGSPMIGNFFSSMLDEYPRSYLSETIRTTFIMLPQSYGRSMNSFNLILLVYTVLPNDLSEFVGMLKKRKTDFHVYSITF